MAARCNTDSVLSVLDAVIDSTSYYEAELRTRLGKQRQAFENTTDPAVKFQEAHRLVISYRKFRIDSAMYYARQQYEYGLKIGNADSLALARMSLADVLKRLGRFSDAKGLLDRIPRNEFVASNIYYYEIYHSTLNSMLNVAAGEDEMNEIRLMRKLYRDTITMLRHDNGSVLLMYRADMLQYSGNNKAALKLLKECHDRYSNEVDSDPIYWAVIGGVYKNLGKKEEAKYCYAMSSILDKRSCNKTYTSLQMLAALLFDDGDTDRAYRYIMLSMNDVHEAHAHSRLALVGEYLPIITTAYEKKQRVIAVRRTMLIVGAMVLAIALATLLIMLARRTRKLASLRHVLAERNQQLQSLNEKLAGVNKALEESSIIKEVYIGQLFNLCSSYIGQMENYRTGLIAKFKTGRMKELERTLNQDTTNAQLKLLFKNFDKVFLEIFPNFIEDFNGLLKPGEKIYPKPGELLSPELRIYALVRLGINDSTRIAEFLHYSVQTVYNYRQKVRNKSVVPRQEFALKVQCI